ncbi:hypothetical protein HYQ46_005556 [Verticillium longisporum]|nr:hypothetical protein HYQ46_005556 [Verticillium longisporum]
MWKAGRQRAKGVACWRFLGVCGGTVVEREGVQSRKEATATSYLLAANSLHRLTANVISRGQAWAAEGLSIEE